MSSAGAEPDYADLEGELADKAVKDLFLDENNPRLSSFDIPTQEAILQVLAKQMNLDEVALSIATNGYYNTERLMVIHRPEGGYTVVEGNRRLAAVQLLLDDTKRAKTKTTNFPTISAERRRQLQHLPVSIFPSREQLWPYLAFRHVNGSRDWDSFAKARYVAHVHEDYGVPVAEITARTGDQFSTVVRMYLGYRLVRQAQDNHLFSPEDRFQEKRFYFSHLYTAASYRAIQRFLGITDLNARQPVPSDNLPCLQELLLWIYGNKQDDIEPLVKSQYPDLGHLRQAIEREDSLEALRRGESLERALEIVRGDAKLLRDSLNDAKYNLRDANKYVTLGYGGERDMGSLADEVAKLAIGIQQRMNDFHLAGDRSVDHTVGHDAEESP